MKKVFLFSVCAVLVFFSLQPVLAQSYYVNAELGDDEENNGRSEEAPFQTLTKALSEAESTGTRTVTIIGTLAAESVSLMSRDEILITGKANPGEGEAAVLYGATFSGGRLRFENITIRNGYLRLNTVTARLGSNTVVMYGIVASNSDLTVNQNARISSSAGYGIDMVFGTLTLEGNAVITNSPCGITAQRAEIRIGGNAAVTNNRGNGGIELSDNCSLTLSGAALISGNSGPKGGGITAGKNCSISMTDTASITGNTSNSNNTFSGGGAVMLTNSSLTLNGGTISGNYAALGGAVFIGVKSMFSVKEGTIQGNRATNGGAAYLSGDTSALNMAGGTISGNSAANGGGVYIYRGTLELPGGLIEGNSATSFGGGVYVRYTGRYSMQSGQQGQVLNNSAGRDGKDLYLQ
jgi:hypothetical protein